MRSSYAAGKLTIGEYLNRWLTDSVKGTVNETTYANYAYITRKHICPALGHVKLKTLTPARMRDFYGEKARTKLSAATVKKCTSCYARLSLRRFRTDSSRATPQTA